MFCVFTFFSSLFSSKEADKKKLMDPLQNMSKFLEAKNSHKRDKDRKHKDKCKKRGDTEKNSKTLPKKSVEQMRKERLRREQEEHERERKLLASVRGENNEATKDLTDGQQTSRYSLIETDFPFYLILVCISCISLLPFLIVSVTKFSIVIGSPRACHVIAARSRGCY